MTIVNKPKSDMDRRTFLGVCAGGALTMILPTFTSKAHAESLGKIDYGIASVAPLWALAFITLQKDYFKTEGLEVNYINSQSGPRTKQMLAAGQIFAATTGANDSMALTIAGKPSVLVVGFDNRISYANLVVNKKLYDSGEITKIEDLEGKTIAVTQPQSATWLMAVYITDRMGLKDKVQIKGLGSLMTMMGAVKSQQVQASIATFSMMNKAVEEGWGVPLFNVTEEEQWKAVFGGGVPGTGCYVLEKTAKEKPELVQAYVSAMCKGTDWAKNHTPEEITDLIYKDFLSGFSKEAVVTGIRLYKKIWNYQNLITKADYGRLLDIMGGGRQLTEEQIKKVPYETAVDMSFVRNARGL